MNFDTWEYREAMLPKDYNEKEAYIQTLQEKFLKEVQTSEVAQAWMQQFDEKNSHKFFEYYAKFKAKIVTYSDQYIRKAEQVSQLKHREFSQGALALILQKKLFDLQCRWRAEQVTLPGIRISYDFWYWSTDIFNCPYLDEVTDTEIEVMQRYIQTDDFDPEHLHPTTYCWQAYDQIKAGREAEDADDRVIPWYDFYDLYMGTAALQLLPDTRGQKEEQYYRPILQKQHEKNKAAAIENGPQVKALRKPWLMASTENFYQLACLCDDPYFIALMKAECEVVAEREAVEAEECDAISYFYRLENVTNPPPVREGLSWRMALKQCFVDYLKDFITHDLADVREEHHLYRSMNLLYTIDGKPEKFTALENFDTSNHFIKLILEARALLGEPEDLNF